MLFPQPFEKFVGDRQGIQLLVEGPHIEFLAVGQQLFVRRGEDLRFGDFTEEV